MIFLNVLLTISSLQMSIGAGVVLVIGSLIAYQVIQSRLKATRINAIQLLERLQGSFEGLDDLLKYFDKYPDIKTGDSTYRVDYLQAIGEYRDFTYKNIVGDARSGTKPMTKSEVKAFIEQVKWNIVGMEDIQKNNVMLVAGIQSLETLESKHRQYEQALPDCERRIQAIANKNTDWWYKLVSFTQFEDLIQLQAKGKQGLQRSWEHLRSNASLEEKARGINHRKQELITMSQDLDKMIREVQLVEETIQSYQNRLADDWEQIDRLAREVKQWQNEYGYIHQTPEQETIRGYGQKVKELAQQTQKDWISIICNLDEALNRQVKVRDYFVDFSEAHQNFRDHLSHDIKALNQTIMSWFNQTNYDYLPGRSEHKEKIQAAKVKLDQALAPLPEVDWLKVQKIGEEMIAAQEALIEAFERFQAAQQAFLELETEYRSLNDRIRDLEETVLVRNDATLRTLQEQRQKVELSNDWFAKLETLKIVLAAQKNYIEALKKRQEKLNNLKFYCEEKLKETQSLKELKHLLAYHDGKRIDELEMPNVEGMFYDDAIRTLRNAKAEMMKVYQEIHDKLVKAQVSHEVKELYKQYNVPYGSPAISRPTKRSPRKTARRKPRVTTNNSYQKSRDEHRGSYGGSSFGGWFEEDDNDYDEDYEYWEEEDDNDDDSSDEDYYEEDSSYGGSSSSSDSSYEDSGSSSYDDDDDDDDY